MLQVTLDLLAVMSAFIQLLNEWKTYSHFVWSIVTSLFRLSKILPTLKRLFSEALSVSECFSFSSSTVNPRHYLRSLVLTTTMAQSSSDSDLCSRAIQIIEALPSSQCLYDILILHGDASSSSSSASTSLWCGLGPSLLSYPEDLSPIFLYHSHFDFIYQNKWMKWGEWDTFTTSITWYKPAPSWGAWVARLTLAKLDKWKMLGISEAIRVSKYEMPINPSLLTSLLCFWSPATNTFFFPWGVHDSYNIWYFCSAELASYGCDGSSLNDRW